MEDGEQKTQAGGREAGGCPSSQTCVRAARDAYYRYSAWAVVRRHITQRRQKYDDRRVLEQIVIPFVLSRFEPQTVLEIGREPYQAFYNEFFVGRELWTIDWDAARAQFGAPNHIVDDAANLRNHFRERYFDFVLMNGVFGWGLNERPAIERAFAAVHAILAPGGIFVLGWNDTPDLVPVPLDQVEALRQFTPYFFEPLNGTSFKCSTYEHMYSFFVK
jgi:SAM-dependent methyltransferase